MAYKQATCQARHAMRVPPLPNKPPPPLPTKPAATEVLPAIPKAFRTAVEPGMVKTAESAMAQGLPLAMLAGLLGIHKRTLMRWIELGSSEACPDPVLASFAAAVERGRAAFGAEGIKVLRAHALTDWKPMHELLKAQDPDTWSPKSKVDVKVERAAEVEDLSHLSEAELEERALLETRLAELSKKRK